MLGADSAPGDRSGCTCVRPGAATVTVSPSDVERPLARHRHVPEASLVVGHPDEGLLRLSRLLADGGLELAINRSLEVADVGLEGVGGPPLDELPVGLSAWAGAF